MVATLPSQKNFNQASHKSRYQRLQPRDGNLQSRVLVVLFLPERLGRVWSLPGADGSH